jgi:hypothetical protein
MELLKKEVPENLKRAIKAYCPETENPPVNIIIAGGFIRAYFAGERASDMDVYFNSKEDAEKFEDCLLDEFQFETSWTNVFETERAVTYKSYKNGKKTVQVIKLITGEPVEIIGKFDFTICQCCVHISPDWSTCQLYIHPDFFEHLAGRILVFNPDTLYPLSSLKRVIKYIKLGYHICDENIISISETIAKRVDFNDKENLEDHIQGMDPNGDRRIRVID